MCCARDPPLVTPSAKDVCRDKRNPQKCLLLNNPVVTIVPVYRVENRDQTWTIAFNGREPGASVFVPVNVQLLENQLSMKFTSCDLKW